MFRNYIIPCLPWRLGRAPLEGILPSCRKKGFLQGNVTLWKKKKKAFPRGRQTLETRPRGAWQIRGARGKKRSLGVLKAEGKGRGIWGAAPGPAPPLPAGSGPITAPVPSWPRQPAARRRLSSRAVMTPGRRPLSPARAAGSGNWPTNAASGGVQERGASDAPQGWAARTGQPQAPLELKCPQFCGPGSKATSKWHKQEMMEMKANHH